MLAIVRVIGLVGLVVALFDARTTVLVLAAAVVDVVKIEVELLAVLVARVVTAKYITVVSKIIQLYHKIFFLPIV